jgi:ATP-dependent RNA/DNA helicase IGHMBP2
LGVRSNESWTRSTTQGGTGFLSNIRRMNVGMTHARRKLLLASDLSTPCVHPFYGEFLTYVKGAWYRSADEVQSEPNVSIDPRF